MILEFLEKYLLKKRSEKQHEVIKLQWEKAELERKLAELKRERGSSF